MCVLGKVGIFAVYLPTYLPRYMYYVYIDIPPEPFPIPLFSHSSLLGFPALGLHACLPAWLNGLLGGSLECRVIPFPFLSLFSPVLIQHKRDIIYCRVSFMPDIYHPSYVPSMDYST